MQRLRRARPSAVVAQAVHGFAPAAGGVDLGIGPVRRDDEPERVLQAVALLGEHLRLVLEDDARDVPRRHVGQVAVGEPHDLVVGDRRFATVAAAAGGGEAHADDVDAPVLARADLLLQRAVAFELAVVVGEDGRHRHARHLVEVALQEHPAVALARPHEGGEVVLVQRLHRRDGLDAQALLDRRLAGDAVDHDRNLDHAAQRALDEHGGDADQAQHEPGDRHPPGAALGAFEHQRAVDLPGAVGVDGVGLCCVARRCRGCDQAMQRLFLASGRHSWGCLL